MEKDIFQVDFNFEELKPLRERITSTIRDLIIEGRINPGERLQEPEMANALKVSRTPLREAFLQLESEGFLIVNPRKGAIVTELSLKDAEELYLIKGTLEALAARIAVNNISEDLLNELTLLNSQMNNISRQDDKDYKKFLEINAKFHQLIYEASGNQRLIKLISLLRNQTLRYNFIFLSLLSHLEESVEEHVEIINALKSKDEDKAEGLLKKHSETARKALQGYIKQNHK